MPAESSEAVTLDQLKMLDPDADGAIYVSKRDGNTSEPTKDEWWALDSEGE